MVVVCAFGPYPWTKFFFSDLISFQIIKIIILCMKPFLDWRNALRSKFRREITDYTHNLTFLNFIKRDVTLWKNPPPSPPSSSVTFCETPPSPPTAWRHMWTAPKSVKWFFNAFITNILWALSEIWELWGSRIYRPFTGGYRRYCIYSEAFPTALLWTSGHCLRWMAFLSLMRNFQKNKKTEFSLERWKNPCIRDNRRAGWRV